MEQPVYYISHDSRMLIGYINTTFKPTTYFETSGTTNTTLCRLIKMDSASAVVTLLIHRSIYLSSVSIMLILILHHSRKSQNIEQNIFNLIALLLTP